MTSDKQKAGGEVTKLQVGERRIVPARLPYHPNYGASFGVDDLTWKALVESVYPEAKKPESVWLALSYCRARNLDPMRKPVHIVPVWSTAAGGYVDTVWPSLTLHRIEAQRTKTYAGMDEAEFGPDVTQEFSGKVKVDGKKVDRTMSLTFPAWCRITVYRLIDGERVAFPGPRVRWTEYYATTGRASAIPNEQWERRPYYMIEKTAESLALRRAFPEECSEPTAEEMQAAVSHGWGPEHAHDITPADAAADRLKERVETYKAEQAAQDQGEDEAPQDAEVEDVDEAEDADGAADAGKAADDGWKPEPALGFPGAPEFEEGSAAFRKGVRYEDNPHRWEAGNAWAAGWKRAGVEAAEAKGGKG